MQDNQQKFEQLRATYPAFTYESFTIAEEKYQYSLRFHFNISDKEHFYPSLVIPKQAIGNLREETWNTLVFHIGMAELISYWKATASPEVYIKPYHLSNNQMDWWKKLYYHGLGEFFHQNGITTTQHEFMTINNLTRESAPFIHADLDDNAVLVPVGGGKDSAVTLELLKTKDFHVRPFAINPRPAILETLDSAGLDRNTLVRAERTIDPRLPELNEQGFLNGHTPFSAVVAFTGLLFAGLTNSKHIALSNESSANEATIPGTSINHQYSKTYEFEKDFRTYYQNFISGRFNYFSFLRPLNELQIASLFSHFKNHFPTFKSCNRGSQDNVWCGECAKCLFTAIILSPFVNRETQERIFGKDLLNDDSLIPLFDQLTGIANEKPFECVGTIDEVNTALSMAAQTWQKPHPALLQHFENQKTLAGGFYENLLNGLDDRHFLEDRFLKIIKEAWDEQKDH